MFGFKKRCLQVRIFEDGKEQDLDRYTDSQLLEIRKAIYKLLPKSPNSAVTYDVFIYEVYQGWTKPRKTTMEVVAFTNYQVQGPHLKKISIPKQVVESFTQKRLPIVPEETLASRWSYPLEAEFHV